MGRKVLQPMSLALTHTDMYKHAYTKHVRPSTYTPSFLRRGLPTRIRIGYSYFKPPIVSRLLLQQIPNSLWWHPRPFPAFHPPPAASALPSTSTAPLTACFPHTCSLTPRPSHHRALPGAPPLCPTSSCSFSVATYNARHCAGLWA